MPNESYELRGKYSKLTPDRDQSPPLRPSLEAAYRSSSEEEFSDIDEFDPLNYDGGSGKRRRTPSSRRAAAESTAYKDAPDPRAGVTRLRLCCFMVLLFTGALVLLLSVGGLWVYKSAPEDGQSPPWYPSPRGGTVKSWEESYKKAAALVKQMTLVEKVNVTTGVGWAMEMCVGNTGAVDRLGFPSLCLQDGPLGIRFADNITAFPAGVTVGATWNKDLMYRRGRAHADEARMKGINVLLGPSMGPLGRMPAGGRNWEGFGADPVLQGVAAAQTIRGIQDAGVIATAKHYIGNEQEHFRQSWEWGTPNAISSNIDDRTLHELYAWPFADSIRAGVASVMCSYNQVNNSYACGNSKLLSGILKDELGFQGFVQSDWLAQRSGVGSALAGLDMSMPGDGLKWTDGKSLWGAQLTKAVLNSSLPMERLNDMTTRIVAAWYQLGQDSRTVWDGGPNFSSWTNDEVGLLHPGSDDKSTGIVNKFVNPQEGHDSIVRDVAAEGTVLVKNEGDVLPLSRDGSSTKNGSKYRVGIYGEDSRTNPNGPNSCADRGCNIGTLAMGWGSGAVEFPYLVAPLDALREAFNTDSVYVTDFPTNTPPIKKSPEILMDQDLCLVFVNSDAGEGFIAADGIRGDRNDLYLQKGGDKLVQDVANGCGNGTGSTVVVVHAVGPVILEKWIDLPGVKAVLLAHLPGQESGNALVDILFGDKNPSGKLPYTIAKRAEDYGEGSKILYYPNGVVPQQNFTEGVYIDYRHFDRYNITPRYEFGFGLSYTKFHLSSLFVHQTKAKTPLPSARPDAVVAPPDFDKAIPAPESALAPPGFRKLKKYIYPYISSTSDVTVGRYPYPSGYSVDAPLSPAGGDQGGNPSLYDIHATVQATLTNIGDRDGAAVVQLYIQFPPNTTDAASGAPMAFPPRVLRAFDKFAVPGGLDKTAGKRKKVVFEVTRRDLSYWSSAQQNWVMPTGTFTFWMGFLSRDLPLTGKF
ncbi:glycosyl hydrolase family 3 N terminal domain-containing protein [Cryomyces antarcticus]